MSAAEDWIYQEDEDDRYAHEPTADPDGGVSIDDLHAYADRLARTRTRLEDEIAGARRRLAWIAHERRARRVLAPSTIHALRILGVISGDDLPGHDERELIQRRHGQIDALDALYAFTVAEIDERTDLDGGSVPT